MKKVGLLTTSLLLTASIAIYTRELSVSVDNLSQGNEPERVQVHKPLTVGQAQSRWISQQKQLRTEAQRSLQSFLSKIMAKLD